MSLLCKFVHVGFTLVKTPILTLECWVPSAYFGYLKKKAKFQ